MCMCIKACVLSHTRLYMRKCAVVIALIMNMIFASFSDTHMNKRHAHIHVYIVCLTSLSLSLTCASRLYNLTMSFIFARCMCTSMHIHTYIHTHTRMMSSVDNCIYSCRAELTRIGTFIQISPTEWREALTKRVQLF